MFRRVYDDLLKWKVSDRRRPLLIKGVRQCGKTYIMDEFGRNEYRKMAYFNFEDTPELSKIFEGQLDPERIIAQLSIAGNVSITPGDTLVVFDEVQVCKRALTSLKYFAESSADYHVVCAGSLLGIHHYTKRKQDDGSPSEAFPVGKVQILDMFPMDFEEFLLANGEERMVESLRGHPVGERVPDYLEPRLRDYLNVFYVVGGMPDAVNAWISTHDITEVRRIQSTILETYTDDLDRHPVDSIGTLEKVWNSVPVQLMKDNTRFIFGQVVKGAKATDLEDAVAWLRDAGLLYCVKVVDNPAIPISMSETGFYKLYMADIGLFHNRSGVPTSFINTEPEQYKDFKGAMAENYVLQNLVTRFGRDQHYWRSGATAEVDFLTEMYYEPIPIEVKSGSAKSSKSLKVYRSRYEPRVSVKTSMDPDVGGSPVTHIPLYLMWDVGRYVHHMLTETGWVDPDDHFQSKYSDLGEDRSAEDSE